jgi:hypothetical protein
MSPERAPKRDPPSKQENAFYTTAAHPFEGGAHTSLDRSSESLPDVVDEVLARVDTDFASPRTVPSSGWSSSPEVTSAAKDMSFARISATSPSASGDELFSQMYSAFVSSRRKDAAASSMAAAAAAATVSPSVVLRSGGVARSTERLDDM